MGSKRICVDSFALRGLINSFIFVLLLVWFLECGLFAQSPWMAIGHDGWDARALAAGPDRPDQLSLGTTSSRIYYSTDGGSSWHQVSRPGTTVDLLVDH